MIEKPKKTDEEIEHEKAMELMEHEPLKTIYDITERNKQLQARIDELGKEKAELKQTVSNLPSKDEIKKIIDGINKNVCDSCEETFGSTLCALWQARGKCDEPEPEDYAKAIHNRITGGK